MFNLHEGPERLDRCVLGAGLVNIKRGSAGIGPEDKPAIIPAAIGFLIFHDSLYPAAVDQFGMAGKEEKTDALDVNVMHADSDFFAPA